MRTSSLFIGLLVVLLVPAAASADTKNKTPAKAPAAAPAKKGDKAPAKAPPAAKTPAAPEKPAGPAVEEKVSGFQLKVREILGTKADGFLPKSVAGLKRGMKPEEVAAKGIFGAGNISELGLAEASLEHNKPGLHSIALVYMKNDKGEWRLNLVVVRFDNTFEYQDILNECLTKYGKPSHEDRPNQVASWVSPKLNSIQLSKSFAENASFELSTTL